MTRISANTWNLGVLLFLSLPQNLRFSLHQCLFLSVHLLVSLCFFYQFLSLYLSKKSFFTSQSLFSVSLFLKTLPLLSVPSLSLPLLSFFPALSLSLFSLLSVSLPQTLPLLSPFLPVCPFSLSPPLSLRPAPSLQQR